MHDPAVLLVLLRWHGVGKRVGLAGNFGKNSTPAGAALGNLRFPGLRLRRDCARDTLPGEAQWPSKGDLQTTYAAVLRLQAVAPHRSMPGAEGLPPSRRYDHVPAGSRLDSGG